MSNEMVYVDLFVRVTVRGSSPVVHHHRAWNADRLFMSLVAMHEKEGNGIEKVSVNEYRKAYWKK